MQIKTCFFLFVLLLVAYMGFAQNNMGGIKVTVVKRNNLRESLSLANVTIYNDSTTVHGTTDTDGNYYYKQFTKGKYNVKVACKNYQTIVEKNVIVKTDGVTYVFMVLKPDSTNTKKADTIQYKIPVVDPSTAGIPPTKNGLFPKLFFKTNSLNFDTLSANYYANDIHIIDTNEAINYIVKYIVTHPNERIIITGYRDMNEQGFYDLNNERAEKVANLLVQHGLPKEKMPEIFSYGGSINPPKAIRHASTESEKQQLHKLNRCVMLWIDGGSNTYALPPKNYDTPILPRLFFKLNSTNFDTLSNYSGNDLHITDTNKVIDYMVKYILDYPDEHIIIASWYNINEQNSQELCNQRAQKVINLLMQHGLPKEKTPSVFPFKRPFNPLIQIQNKNTEQEKELLLRANRCVVFTQMAGG